MIIKSLLCFELCLLLIKVTECHVFQNYFSGTIHMIWKVHANVKNETKIAYLTCTQHDVPKVDLKASISINKIYQSDKKKASTSSSEFHTIEEFYHCFKKFTLF